MSFLEPHSKLWPEQKFTISHQIARVRPPSADGKDGSLLTQSAKAAAAAYLPAGYDPDGRQGDGEVLTLNERGRRCCKQQHSAKSALCCCWLGQSGPHSSQRHRFLGSTAPPRFEVKTLMVRLCSLTEILLLDWTDFTLTYNGGSQWKRQSQRDNSTHLEPDT